MASTRPKSESVLIEKPSRGKMAKVPMSETGTASKGMSVARQPCRKMKTTMMTRSKASKSVLTISSIPAVTASVVLSDSVYCMPGGKRPARSAISFLAEAAASRALLPGVW